MPRPVVSVVAAVARNGAIGRGNELLFRIPEDLKFFKRTTMGAPIVMGRRTWDSIGRPLPGRRNLVVTRNPAWQAPGAERAASLRAALAMAAEAPKVYVIGGAQIYAEALPLADEVILTEIDADAEADVFFPPWDRTPFTATASDWQATADGLRYRWVTYRRGGG